VIVEISGTKANYAASLRANLFKNRNWKYDVCKYDDSRDDCHYGSATWNATGSNQGPFSMSTQYMGGYNKMKHSSTSETNDWYDITDSNWSIDTSPASSTHDTDVINALKLDYTT
jgi:hypothetical protein